MRLPSGEIAGCEKLGFGDGAASIAASSGNASVTSSATAARCIARIGIPLRMFAASVATPTRPQMGHWSWPSYPGGSRYRGPRWFRTGGAMRRVFGCGVLAICTLIAGVTPSLAGPPFFTDDPEPVELRHNEFYVFGTLDHADGASAITGPAIEYNRGIAPSTQFHIVLPMAWNVPAQGATATGIGDIEVGIKYRFMDIEDDGFQLGVFPMVELATGS